MEMSVIKKVFLMLFAFLILQGVFSASSAAQTTNGCLATTTWWFPDAIPPGWFILGPYPAPFIFLIGAYKASCFPAAAGTEACPGCCTPKGGSPAPAGGGSSGSGASSPTLAGKPILLATGNTFINQRDVAIPGLGGGFSLSRTWNSLWPSTQIASSVGLFGPNWRSTY